MATVHEAVTAYARMWNTLDSTEVVAMLAEDVSYSSFWVFGDMHGREEVSAYLTGKMAHFRTPTDPQDHTYAQLGEANAGMPGQTIVVMSRGSRENISVVATIEVADGLIKSISLMPPSFYRPRLLGVFPGLDAF